LLSCYAKLCEVLKAEKEVPGRPNLAGAREPWRQSRRGSHKISPNGAKTGLGSHKFSEVID